jgi:hypothetical protein
MTLIIYLLILLFGLLLWIRGLTMTNKRKERIKYAGVNTVIFIAYSIFWFNHSQVITGHDEYGLGRLFGFPLILSIHSILVFIIINITIRRAKQSYR